MPKYLANVYQASKTPIEVDSTLCHHPEDESSYTIVLMLTCVISHQAYQVATDASDVAFRSGIMW